MLQVWLDEAGLEFDHADGASGGNLNLAMWCQGMSGTPDRRQLAPHAPAWRHRASTGDRGGSCIWADFAAHAGPLPRRNLLPRWGLDWARIRATEREATFNVYDFTDPRARAAARRRAWTRRCSWPRSPSRCGSRPLRIGAAHLPRRRLPLRRQPRGGHRPRRRRALGHLDRQRAERVVGAASWASTSASSRSLPTATSAASLQAHRAQQRRDRGGRARASSAGTSRSGSCAPRSPSTTSSCSSGDRVRECVGAGRGRRATLVRARRASPCATPCRTGEARRDPPAFHRGDEGLRRAGRDRPGGRARRGRGGRPAPHGPPDHHPRRRAPVRRRPGARGQRGGLDRVGGLAGRLPVERGTFNLFTDDGDPTVKWMRYRLFATRPCRGEPRHAERLQAGPGRPGLRRLGRHLHARSRASSAATWSWPTRTAAEVLGAGVIHVHLLDFLHQLTTFEVEAASRPGAGRRARRVRAVLHGPALGRLRAAGPDARRPSDGSEPSDRSTAGPDPRVDQAPGRAGGPTRSCPSPARSSCPWRSTRSGSIFANVP